MQVAGEEQRTDGLHGDSEEDPLEPSQPGLRRQRAVGDFLLLEVHAPARLVRVEAGRHHGRRSLLSRLSSVESNHGTAGMHPTLFAFIVLTSRLSGSADASEPGGWMERVTCAVSRLSASENLFCRTMSSRAMVGVSGASDAGGAASRQRLRALSAVAREARACAPVAAAERPPRIASPDPVPHEAGARRHAGAFRRDRDEPPAGAVSALPRRSSAKHLLRGGSVAG